MINIVDYVLISNHYKESDYPGCIRDCVDNSSEILVFDFFLISNNYREIGWDG